MASLLDQQWAAFLQNGSVALSPLSNMKTTNFNDEASAPAENSNQDNTTPNTSLAETLDTHNGHSTTDADNATEGRNSTNGRNATEGPNATEGVITKDGIELPPLIISTKSNNAKLNNQGGDLDVWRMFWAVRVIPYISQQEGVIKKQIKVQCTSQAELDQLHERLKNVRSHKLTKEEGVDGRAQRKAKAEATETHTCYSPSCRKGNHACYSSCCIRNEEQRSFRYVAKLTVGLSSKEVKAHRSKEKNAFFNSFTMIMRVRYQGSFKEIVIKVFNKNVLSLPGMLDDELLNNTLSLIDRVLGDASEIVAPEKPRLAHKPGTISDVMVNSNFWCGFGLDRDKVVMLMRDKFGMETSYDPSNYPGVICRFYEARGENVDKAAPGICPCNPPCSTLRIGDKRAAASTIEENANVCVKLTFMLFRTGSVLIVGRCNRTLLGKVHNYISHLLITNRKAIQSGPGEKPSKKGVERKHRKRTIWVHADADVAK
jgi:hypothetical protein